MNDIEKAMAFLREERRQRAGAPRSAAVPASGIASRGVPQRAEGATGTAEAVPVFEQRARPRFDDELFGDDVLDGIGTGNDASTSSTEAAALREERSAGVELGDPEVPVADRSLDKTDPKGAAASLAIEPESVTEVSKSFADMEAPRSARGLATETSRTGSASEAVTNRGVHASDAVEPGGAPAVRTDDRDSVAERLVSLPLKQLAKRGFLTPEVGKGRLSEEFRRVKRPILRNIAEASETDEHRNVIMVTSSVSGEGKTYTSINLAMSLAAERRRTVLLVDADVLKGSAGTVLGVDDDRPGLIDVLDDESLDIADVMLSTDVPDLRFVPAGRRDDQSTELLSSPRMRDLIDELARRYADRVIVLDCPPMLQTNEANVIADHAGQVVFVVAGEETDQRLVLEAMNRFDEDKSVGILLNKASGSSAAYGYDYGYG